MILNFEKSPLLLTYKNPPDLLILDSLYRIISSYWLAHFYLMKKSAKVLNNPLSAPVYEASNRPPNIKCIVPAFFGDRFRGKYDGLCTLNSPAEEVGGLEVFLYEAALNFELF